MFDFICEIGFRIIKPFVLFILRKKGYSEDAIKRKDGFIKGNSFEQDKKTIMIHGVSVGEINALENLVKHVRSEFLDYRLIVTTGTHTGQDIAHKKLEQYTDLITYFPFDYPSAIKRFMDYVKPNIVMIAETEIWPNFAYECNKRGIKLFVINGRISDSTFKTYKHFKFLFKRFLNQYTGIYTQSEDDNNKFLILGANPKVTAKMNNLKFDIEKPKQTFDINKDGAKVLLAGSTHPQEEEIILDVFSDLKKKNNSLKLILAPRHINRIDEIKILLNNYGYNYKQRSDGINSLEGIDILVLDTLGELGKMYAFSEISFIGGSFNKTGGHNPLESIIFSKPVISGPSVHNFKDIYSIITKAGAGFVVKNKQELFTIAQRMLSDEDFYNETVTRCCKVFEEQQGALDFVIDIIKTNVDS